MMYLCRLFRSAALALSLISLIPSFCQGGQIDVASGVADALVDAVTQAQAGDVVNLTDVGPYEITQTISVQVPLTIQADPSLTQKPVVVGLVGSMHFIAAAANIEVVGIEFDGAIDGIPSLEKFISCADNVTGINVVVRNCTVHHLADDIIRANTDVNLIYVDGLFAYKCHDRSFDFRANVDSMVIMNSTIYQNDGKARLAGLFNYAEFNAVTWVGTVSDEAVEFRQTEPNIVVKNSLFVNNKKGPFDFEPGTTVTIDYTNLYQDPERVALDLTDPAWLDSAFSPGSLVEQAYNNGSGNIQENPGFADTAGLYFMVDINTQTAFGSEDGTPMGDPRWGTWDPSDIEEFLNNQLPDNFALYQNYPNPFNPRTDIAYAIPHTSEVRLTVFDLLGREVIVLYSGIRSTGVYKAIWDGRDSQGNPVSGGVYIYRLQTDDFSSARKMLFLK